MKPKEFSKQVKNKVVEKYKSGRGSTTIPTWWWKHYAVVNGEWPALLQRFIKSPKTPKRFTLQSVIQPFIHTVTVVSYILATAALGRTDRSEAATEPSDNHQQARPVKCFAQEHND
ncbi:hypothetical protein ILYODFUR_014257 [Ilyodon furcidens]|uniref:Uncharacterized protein n=1 Tax=Ilyodon furcidens TaxID=33524 RepID=A0ABV0VGN8_9TELE